MLRRHVLRYEEGDCRRSCCFKEDGTEEKLQEAQEIIDSALLESDDGFNKFIWDAHEIFDEYDMAGTRMLIRGQEKAANDILVSKGWISLADVYRMLKIPVTKASMFVGWVYDPKSKDLADSQVIIDQDTVYYDDGFGHKHPAIYLRFNINPYSNFIERLPLEKI